MGIFGRKDELFEIMSQRSGGRAAGKAASSGGTATAVPVEPTTPTASVLEPFGQAPPVEDVLELEGDALVVVEDGWEEGDPMEPEGVGTVKVRGDTAIVGVLLVLCMVGVAYLMGRRNKTPQEGAQVEAGETPLVAQAPRGGAAAPAGTPGGSTAEPQPQPTARNVEPGTHELIVCNTTESNAGAVARWLNEDRASPIVSREDLEAFTRGGTVRIRGFQGAEAEVLQRVRRVVDPTGGNRQFHDAYYVSVRR